MSPKWDFSEEEVDAPEPLDPESSLLRPAGKKRRSIPARLKHKARGFRIEQTTDGRAWKLKKYYRDEAAMRSAYLASRRRDWSPNLYRMVFPDEKIVPLANDERDPSYRFNRRR